MCALDVGRAECEHQAAARAALRQAEEDRSHAKELQQDLEKCRRELFALKAELAESERSRQLEGMEKLRHLGLQPEEANFVLSELELSDAGAAREVREVLFDGTPEDCTSECIMRWHRESGLGADSLIAVQIQPGFDSEGHAQSSGSVVCTYDKRADAEEAVMTLQDTVLTSASGKQSRVQAKLLSNASADRGAGLSPAAVCTSPSARSMAMSERGVQSPVSETAKPSRPKLVTGDSSESLGHQWSGTSSPVGKEAKTVARAGRSDFVAQQNDSPVAGRGIGSTRDDGSAALQASILEQRQKVEFLTAENKKLRVCLEELQAKLHQLMGNCTERGFGEAVNEIASRVGLKRILACPSRFDFLYQDAFRRIERLEDLRRRTLEERRKLLEGCSKASEPSVRSIVERSPLVVLQQLLSEGPVGFSLTSSTGSPKRCKRSKPASNGPNPEKPGVQASKGHDVLLPLILPKNTPGTASAPNLRATNLQSHSMEGRKLLD